ncbi:MAG TPA: glycosyltransferase [Rariglobus sp.]|jgi:hypothetical protein|nr:glycosyltransferase [Rariglobus sp.]
MTTTHTGDIRVKFFGKGQPTYDRSKIISRFPGRDGVWGRCKFIFDLDCRDYDWVLVYDDLNSKDGGERFSTRIEELACPQKNTLLVTTEPSSIKVYSRAFTSQFGVVLTSQEPWALRHPHAIFSQPGLNWFYGHDYNHIRDNPPLTKTSEFSTVCSSKQQKHTLHSLRYEFTQKLKAVMPELEIFGHGVRPIDSKTEALDSFRYHLAIENHLALHHWTEKLSDSFLGLSLPFYFGCPNVFDYFPEGSVVPIDIRNFDESVETIRRTIHDNAWEKRLDLLKESRRRVLEEYHLFAVAEKIIRERHQHGVGTQGGRLLSRRAARHQNAWTGVSHILELANARVRNYLATR